MNQVITAWDVYLITRLDSIKLFLILMAVVGALGTVVFTLIASDQYDKEQKVSLKRAKMSFISATILAFFVTLVPSTNEFAAMKVIPAIANSEDVQGIGQDIVILGKEWLQELRPNKESK